MGVHQCGSQVNQWFAVNLGLSRFAALEARVARWRRGSRAGAGPVRDGVARGTAEGYLVVADALRHRHPVRSESKRAGHRGRAWPGTRHARTVTANEH